MTSRNAPTEGYLVLADGEVFEGVIQTPNIEPHAGEVVFNTSMTGYQEIISDPSYAGQIITFTSTQIGNYGCTSSDDEAARPACSGVVVRELSEISSSWRAEQSLLEYLRVNQVPVISEVDTRRLTKHLRDNGAIPGVIGAGSLDELSAAARLASSTDGCDFVGQVSCPQKSQVRAEEGRLHVAALDFGAKKTIVNQLLAQPEIGLVTIVPARTAANEILALKPDGLFLSNGPGDPAALGDIVGVLKQLLGQLPIFGICLGHQLLAQAVGGETAKLPFGHHGGNHPVRNEANKAIEITAQNHNYHVIAESLPTDVVVTHVNLNDGTVEGLAIPRLRAFSVQYHPEAGPGPHDARYLFRDFVELMNESETEVA